MSSGNSPALALELPYSWRRLIPAGSLLVAALLLPWLVAWPAAIRIPVMSGGVALATLAAWQAGLFGSARRITRLVWNQNGEWQLQFATGEPLRATLAAGSWWSPWLMCWRLVDENGRGHGLLLWRAEFSQIRWRQWQLRLRLERAPAGTVAVEPLQ